MSEYTGFGLEVKTKLLGPPRRTQTWLAGQVSAATGMYVDSAYLSRILAGKRNAPKIVQAIREILDIPAPNASALSEKVIATSLTRHH